MNLHDFYTGKCFDAYRYFGAHKNHLGWTFRVYAPNALKVSLMGDFSQWHEVEMKRVDTGGVYEVNISDAKEGQYYKYRICGADGKELDRSDPYGFETELRPGWASQLIDLDSYQFHDQDFLSKQTKHYTKPMNIYELHLGSYKRHNDGSWYTYSELAQNLIPYLKDNGFTHVELLPVAEHPSDESWGYQTSGFYSATSRYGSSKELMFLIDQLHQAGIGVILDVVIVHFVVNDYALWHFDGTSLYEFDNASSGYSEWGSLNFNYYRQDVCSFMQSSLAFWLDIYHADGLRLDAISNAIYWQGDISRGVNEGAIAFIQKMNKGLHQKYPNAILIAEDSSHYLKVTAPVAYDGLGFDYKWDMGWMNDTLKFFALPFSQRKNNMNLLTFSMLYFYNELYLLALSHDEVVHGKKTMVGKMPGDYEQKFAGARLLYLYMFTHPGKKLNFMGNEIGMFREWDEKKEVDWCLLDYPMHQSFARFFRDLSLTYQSHEDLYNADYHSQSFKQIYLEDAVYSFQRGEMLVLFNFDIEPMTLTYLGSQDLEEIMNTQWDIYHGDEDSQKKQVLKTDEKIKLAPLQGKLFVVKGKEKQNEKSTPLFIKTWKNRF